MPDFGPLPHCSSATRSGGMLRVVDVLRAQISFSVVLRIRGLLATGSRPNVCN